MCVTEFFQVFYLFICLILLNQYFSVFFDQSICKKCSSRLSRTDLPLGLNWFLTYPLQLPYKSLWTFRLICGS